MSLRSGMPIQSFWATIAHCRISRKNSAADRFVAVLGIGQRFKKVVCGSAGLLLAALLICALSPAPVLAQAWTQSAGHTYTKFSYSSVTASDRYTFDGRQVDYNEGQAEVPFQDRSMYLYTEVGATDDLTLVLNVPIKRLKILSPTFRYETQALGSVRLGGRYDLDALLGILSPPHQLAINGTATLPTGYTRNYRPSAGPGQVNLSLTIDYGRSLNALPIYIQVGAGFRYRSGWYGLSTAKSCQPVNDIDCLADQTENLGDEWLASAEVGATPLGGGVLVQALAKTTWSVLRPETSFLASNPVPKRRRSIKVGGGLTIYPSRLLGASALSSLGFGVQGFWTPAGRNTVRSRDFFIGVEYSASL